MTTQIPTVVIIKFAKFGHRRFFASLSSLFAVLVVMQRVDAVNFVLGKVQNLEIVFPILPKQTAAVAMKVRAGMMKPTKKK